MSSVRRRPTGNGNLVLRMAPGDSILIDSHIEVCISEIEGRKRVKIVVKAPQSTKVRRRLFEEARNAIQGKDPETT